MSFPGAFSTYSTVDTALNDGTIFRTRDIEQQVHWRNKNEAEFYKFLREVKQGPVATQPEHRWGETDKAPNYVVVKAACDSSAASIDVFDAYQCVTGDVLYNSRTTEIVRADAIDDADTISVAATTGYGRGHMGSTAAAMRIGDRLIKMGTQLAEQGTAADSRGVTPTALWNYLEAWQKTWQITTMQENAEMLDGVGKIDEQYMRSLWELDEEVNTALFFSRRNRVNDAAGTLYSMNGLDAQIMSHAIDFSNIVVPSWELFNETLSPLFDATASSGEKVAFCGRGACNALVNAARAIGVKEEHWETLYGTDVGAINVDGGTIQIIKDYRTLQGPVLSGSMRIIDPAHVEYCPYRGFDRVVIPNVQLKSQPTLRKDMALQAGTLIVRHEDCHAKVEGLSDAYDSLR